MKSRENSPQFVIINEKNTVNENTVDFLLEIVSKRLKLEIQFNGNYNYFKKYLSTFGCKTRKKRFNDLGNRQQNQDFN